ncbi:MAG: phage protease [Bacteroidota bacterium]
MKEKLIALLKSLGILTDDKVDAVSKELEKLDLDKKPEPTIDASKISDPAMKQVIEELQNQNLILSRQIKTLTDTLTAERTERERAIQLQRQQAEKEKTQKVSDLIARALKEGKIVKAKEEWLKKFADQDLDAATEWVNGAPVDKNFVPEKKDDKKSDPPATEIKAGSLADYMTHKAEHTKAAAAAFAESRKN